MHTQTLKQWALALTFWLAVNKIVLHAQLLGPYGTGATTFEVDSNGLLSATGTLGTGTLPSNLTGVGTRMFWYPGKAAFRAGNINGSFGSDQAWNDASIGIGSVAFGIDNTASGTYSTASGYLNTASGWYAVAMGGFNVANNGSSTLGWGNTASSYSSAFGEDNTASGYNSTAFGFAVYAIGDYSTAFGNNNVARGYSSTAAGWCTTASAYASFVVGQANSGRSSTGAAANPNEWVLTDPLFEVGNGNIDGRTDAFVVYKNGNAVFSPPAGTPAAPAGTPTCTVSAPAFVTTTPGGVGDIPMYTGN